jgi:uncharacterized protein
MRASKGSGFGVVTLTQGREVHRPGAAAEQFEIHGHTGADRAHRAAPARFGHGLVPGRGQSFASKPPSSAATACGWAKYTALPPEPAVQVPEDLQHLSTQMHKVLTQLSEQASVVPHWAEAWRLQDCCWLSNRWGELLPLPLQMKYRLFALQEPLDAARAGGRHGGPF